MPRKWNVIQQKRGKLKIAKYTIFATFKSFVRRRHRFVTQIYRRWKSMRALIYNCIFLTNFY